jgi:hypothetical protein
MARRMLTRRAVRGLDLAGGRLIAVTSISTGDELIAAGTDVTDRARLWGNLAMLVRRGTLRVLPRGAAGDGLTAPERQRRDAAVAGQAKSHGEGRADGVVPPEPPPELPEDDETDEGDGEDEETPPPEPKPHGGPPEGLFPKANAGKAKGRKH